MNDFLLGHMDAKLRIFLLLGTLVYLGVILFMLKTKRLTVRYSIIWLISGFVLLIFSIAPYVVFVLRDLLHVEVPANLVFMLLFGFVLLLLLSISCAISGFSEKIKRLTQQTALLEKRIRELEQSKSQENK